MLWVMESSGGRQLWLEGSPKLPRAGGMWLSEPGTSRPAGSIRSRGGNMCKSRKGQALLDEDWGLLRGGQGWPLSCRGDLYYVAPLSAPERSPSSLMPCPSALPDSLTTLTLLSVCWDMSWRTVSGAPGQRLGFISSLAPSVRPACLPIVFLSACPWRMLERVAPSPGVFLT